LVLITVLVGIRFNANHAPMTLYRHAVFSHQLDSEIIEQKILISKVRLEVLMVV
jgi:hypothetical protein